MSDSIDWSGRVAILGSGREGLAAYDYLRGLGNCGSLEIITENRSGRGREEELLAEGVIRIAPFGKAALEQFDVLVRSPGVSIYRKSLVRARAAGVRITTPSSIWFGAHPDARTVVITGTKGKSTTATLLAHLLRSKGLQVELAGNIGRPLLACGDSEPDWWVIELSSYQIADLEARPTIGLIHNLDVDHLDWHGSEAQYREDKLRLAILVPPDGLLLNADDRSLSRHFESRPGTHWYSRELVDALEEELQRSDWPQSLAGRHGRENVAACLAVMRHMGLEVSGLADALASFEGLPHRLQSLGMRDGLEYVNDSISSAPLATLAAIERYSDREVVLLLGGYDRGVDWTRYADGFVKNCPKAIIAMPDNGPGIVEALEKCGVRPELGYFGASNLREAVETAAGIAPRGAVVLLSPGAPSFPHFRDFEDRGEQFRQVCGTKK